MDINSLSSLTNLNQLQGLSNISGNDNGSSDGSFMELLDQFMNSTISSAGTTDLSSETKTKTENSVNGMSGLDSQYMVRMLQMMAIESMNSSANASQIGSVSDDDSASGSIIGDSSASGSNMSQMYQMLLENMMKNQSGSSNNGTADNDISTMISNSSSL